MKTLQNTTTEREFTQFELTKDVLTKLHDFEITPTAKLVLLYLTSCFNPNNKTVYPHITTIAEALGISERTTKRCIQELLKAGIILKTKHYKNSNSYLFTRKIFEHSGQNDTLQVPKCHVEKCQNDTLHVHEQIKHEQINEQRHVDVDVVRINSDFQNPEPQPPKATKTDKQDEIPPIILNNSNIRNHKAYWASLTPEIKQEYIEKQKQADDKEQRQIEHQREVEKYKQEQAEIDRKIDEQMQKPLTERFTRTQAIKMVRNFRKHSLPITTGMVTDLIREFELKESELM